MNSPNVILFSNRFTVNIFLNTGKNMRFGRPTDDESFLSDSQVMEVERLTSGQVL